MRTEQDAKLNPMPGDVLAVTDEHEDMECREVMRLSGSRVVYRCGITPDDLFIEDQAYIEHGWQNWAAGATVLKAAQEAPNE